MQFLFILFFCITLIFSRKEIINYDYLKHGDDWGAAYHYCTDGTQQSPINISNFPEIHPFNSTNYFLAHYIPSLANLTYYNTSVVVDTYDTKAGFGVFYTVAPDYIPTSMYFTGTTLRVRAPAEHIMDLDGKRYKMEIQIQHKLELKLSYKFKYAIVSVFVDDETDTHNKFLDSLISQNKTSNITLNLDDLISIEESNFKSYYSYQGSLSSPGCYEYINWYIFKEPVQASKAQVKFFTDLYSNNADFKGDGNNRRIQSGNRTANIKLFYASKEIQENIINI